jgi:hypothetical protein
VLEYIRNSPNIIFQLEVKVILSRKGCDSGSGGHPSPILPDGRLISLPIPQKNSNIRYCDIEIEKNRTYFDLMKGLGMKFDIDSCCHLDPDLLYEAYKRKRGWKPLFGQMSGAQSHLQRQGVTKGDLFLFFGWFRKTTQKGKNFYFSKNDPGRHIIFGYMQIGSITQLHHFEVIEEWMQYHPHADYKYKNNRFNTIYIARDFLSWDSSLPGAGVFNYNDKLLLTKKGHNRTIWKLPKFFQNISISYHDKQNWKHGLFKSANRGQEFVIDENALVVQWAKELITHSI